MKLDPLSDWGRSEFESCTIATLCHYVYFAKSHILKWKSARKQKRFVTVFVTIEIWIRFHLCQLFDGFRVCKKHANFDDIRMRTSSHPYCASNANTQSKQMGHIVKIFWRSGRGVILVFELYCCHYKNPRGTPSPGALTVQGWESLQICPLSQKARDRPSHTYYGTLIGSRRWPIDPCRFQRPGVTVKGWTEMSNFWMILVIVHQPVDLEWPNSGW